MAQYIKVNLEVEKYQEEDEKFVQMDKLFKSIGIL